LKKRVTLTQEEVSAEALLSHIRGHWAACENGSHYRRDVTLGEDASQISSKNAARSMATLRNLILGLFELQKQTQASNSEYVPGWRRKMTAMAAVDRLVHHSVLLEFDGKSHRAQKGSKSKEEAVDQELHAAQNNQGK
jgi:hypothetical protein